MLTNAGLVILGRNVQYHRWIIFSHASHIPDVAVGKFENIIADNVDDFDNIRQTGRLNFVLLTFKRPSTIRCIIVTVRRAPFHYSCSGRNAIG
uniref:Uncharacterized protein n=1 Tax=Romanomermis culicivorax TaxID=13658 RepID=A0A915KU84_ROMCU